MLFFSKNFVCFQSQLPAAASQCHFFTPCGTLRLNHTKIHVILLKFNAKPVKNRLFFYFLLIFFRYSVLLPAFRFLPCPIVPVLHEIAHSFEHIDVHKQEIVGDIED